MLLAVAATVAVLTVQAQTPDPLPHDTTISTIDRFCNHHVPLGHAKCSEWRSLDPEVAWWRRFMKEVYTNRSLTPEQCEALLAPYQDTYGPKLRRSNDLLEQISQEQYLEFVAYCASHVSDPVCRNKFDRSLYDEEEGQNYNPIPRSKLPVAWSADEMMEDFDFIAAAAHKLSKKTKKF